METGARAVVAERMSVRATEAWVKQQLSPKPAKPGSGKSEKSPAVKDLEQRLTRATGGQVSIEEDAPGKAGVLRIRYQDLDHLDRLLDKLL